MLATPLLQAPPQFSPKLNSEDASQYRPSRDLVAFNKLLPPPIEFIEGSSTGALAVPEGKYEPINSSPKIAKLELDNKLPETPKPPSPSPVKAPRNSTTTSKPRSKSESLYPHPIDVTWPQACNIGNGLFNTGNTCFLNGALQILVHTPPLLRILITHDINKCPSNHGFCMICALREVMVKSHGKGRNPFMPYMISGKLQVIAKHMRRGRQEDSHEFLRYGIDALQKACLAGLPKKINPKLAETTWVHKIFGGQLRSRVTCDDCGHNSDTFDSILDLSLDIHHANTLKDALRKFVAIDHLRGADKYKCEKCKKPVIAEKRFTVHEAPLVLTVHLKRFSPLGHKIGHHVGYDEQLSLRPFMSEGQHGPTYSLYGVICHAGGGPNSGHYYAYVKSREGRWYEMNDDLVTPNRGAPVGIKSAYMLFYMRNRGEGLEAAVKSTLNDQPPQQKSGIVNGMKKRKVRSDEEKEGNEDIGVRVGQPFIGPLLPSPVINGDSTDLKRPKLTPLDSRTDRVIGATQNALSSLTNYNSDTEEDIGVAEPTTSQPLPSIGSSSPAPSLPPPSSAPQSSPTSIPPSSFYSGLNSNKEKKRKPLDAEDESMNRLKNASASETRASREQSGYKSSNDRRGSFNPYSRMGSFGGGRPGNVITYKKRGTARGI